MTCTRYIELNPARAGFVKNPGDWRWSSASEHITAKDDILVSARPLLEIVNKPWEEFLTFDVRE